MVVAFMVVIVAGIFMIQSLQNRTVPVSLGDGVVTRARVASTDTQRQRGLSGTKSLAENNSMLFIFDHPSKWGVWMKDMHYSLDIIWMDGNKKIVHIERDVSPSTYPRSFVPDKDALYVLELPAGYASRHSVYTGQTVSFVAN
jgi:uncharacterized membrane protein (UPF0127 family)